MAYNKVINQEIEYPIEYHIPSSASSITKELFRHNLAERRIEKIDYFRYDLRELVHLPDFCECKSTAFFLHMQKNITIFQKIAQNGEGKFGYIKKFLYLCTRFQRVGTVSDLFTYFLTFRRF